MFLPALLLLLAAEVSAEAEPFSAPSNFTAELTDPRAVVLHWRPDAPEAQGYFVEYQNPGDDSFVILDIMRKEADSFQHLNLAGETRFIYRVRPYFGNASGTVSCTTGRKPDTPNREEEGPVEPGSSGSGNFNIRSLQTIAQAIPTGLVVTPSGATNVILHWKDNAMQEEGYLVELALNKPENFAICALLPPDTVSFRKILLPPETICYFRVRAFFHGESTPLVSVSTPPRAVPTALEKAGK